ncbi:MAG: acylphosphatase [Patescibacteria group bacterium]|nr:acylphosphatase [Patescibacteria group bacterium]
MMFSTIIRVKGNVQCVGFRRHAKEVADSLGIVGIVRNEPDGSVYIEAVGENEAIQKFIDWCKKGPPSAVVQSVQIEAKNLPQRSSFEIKVF